MASSLGRDHGFREVSSRASHVSYPKPWKSYSDQLDQLIGRGMVVTDRARALDCLERIGYYRLSGYWFAFRERSEPLCPLDEHGRKPKKVREERIALDAFRAGTTFQNAVDLYVFDKQLRLLVMDALDTAYHWRSGWPARCGTSARFRRCSTAFARPSKTRLPASTT